MFEIILGYIDFLSLRKLGVLPRAVRGVFDRAVLKKPHLRVAEIATTFMCNSNCIMCSCAKFYNCEKEKNRMSVSEYKSLGRELDKLGCISVNVTGGEPLIRKDIDDVIIALKPKNKIVNLITNGINLTREKIKYYSSIGIDSIVVSLESISAEENDKIRGHEGHFQVVMNAIQWAKEEKVKFGISLTLGDFNFKKVYELIQFAQSKSIFLCIAHCGSIGKWAGNDSMFLSGKNAIKVISLIKKHGKIKIDFSANLSLKPGCPAFIEKIYITPYGDVLPCTFNPISFGNLREESLSIIWNRMLKFYNENVHSKTLCLRSYDKEFIGKFLNPIKNMKQPVRIDEHPYFKTHGSLK
ncbi:radical SAM protein [bacterium]|nr:radical SAM protein [bacterium]